MSFRRWQIAKSDKALSRSIAGRYGIDGFAAHLLSSRGFCSDDEIKDMLGIDEDFAEFIDPFAIIDMEKAVTRIRRAIDSDERIAVYGDYDVDGITSTALLYSYLESAGANVIYYIPDRETEGYGLHCGSIDRLHAQGVSLIVTVDNGISAVCEVAYATSLGIEVVITDHHQEGDELPDAVAVVNPHRKDAVCPFREYAGVGVAFKLVCALEGDSDSVLENYGDLAALGTVADVVSLTGENRRLVRFGLQQIENGGRLGLRMLIDYAGVTGRKISSGTIAYILAPRLNAAGRMGSAERSVRLLLSEDREETSDLAQELIDANRERQTVEQGILRDVRRLLENRPALLYDRVLVIEGAGWHHGVVGIVASRVCEQYGKPCVVISYDGDTAKGSGRSVEGFSLYDAISSCADLLTAFGGHPMAAGISLPTERIGMFREAINAYAAQTFPRMPAPKLAIDCQLPPSMLTLELCDASQLLEPFGEDNPAPVVAVMGLTVADVFGAGGGKHQKITLTRGKSTIVAMKFFTDSEDFPYEAGDIVDIAVTFDRTVFRGADSLTLVVQDIRLSETRFDEIYDGRALYERFMRGEPLDESERLSLCPDRAELGAVYRVARGGYRGGEDMLCCQARRDGVGYGKLLTALTILAEGGLVHQAFDGTVWRVEAPEQPAGAGRVALENTPTARRIGYRNV